MVWSGILRCGIPTETLAAEARGLLAEATQAREEAGRLATEADALIARTRAAEALAADYRGLASNSPSVRVVTQYLYDQEGRLLGEYDEEGHIQREYVYLDGMPLVRLVPPNDRLEGTDIYYYHVDQLGTPQKLTDQDQAVAWDAIYGPFGKVSLAPHRSTSRCGSRGSTRTPRHPAVSDGQ